MQIIYNAPGTATNLTTYMVTEWRNPRASGNFTRRFYDGLGQMVQEQTAADAWNSGGTGSEVRVRYGYDEFGRQVRQSIPQSRIWGDFSLGVNWSSDPNTRTTYDAIDRVTNSYAPNGEQQSYGYAKRAWSITAKGRNGEADKLIHWEERDNL
ncbi:MAG: hypothetical protein KDE46_29505, partial [Caldilineaceae bacterium]|nr:hypothetical protein [Caldilineaceae bacterium]